MHVQHIASRYSNCVSARANMAVNRLCTAMQALRHLMREGSPIADLYAVCNTCTCLQSELRGLLLEAHEVRRSVAAFCRDLVCRFVF